METFYEKQKFNQLWVWGIILLSLITAGIALYLSALNIESVLIFGIIAILPLFFASIKLESKIDQQGIHYRMKPLELKYKVIEWKEIKSIEVRTYSPIKEFGGWGWRIGRNGNARNIKGTKGIQIQFIKGKPLLIGTQKPKEAKAIIQKFMEIR